MITEKEDMDKIRNWIEDNFANSTEPPAVYFSDLVQVWSVVRCLADTMLMLYGA